MSTIAEILEERSGELWSVRSDQSVYEAIRLMSDKGIGAVLVMDDGRLSGILSERDYTRKVILADRSSHDTPARDIMTTDVITCTGERNVMECLSLMTEKDFRHLPVMEGDKVVGMISIGDLVRAVIREQQFTIDQLQHYIAG